MIDTAKYIGIPYKHMGRDKSGLDCWGGIKLIYKEELGITLWDIGEEYPEDWAFEGKDLFMKNYQKQWCAVDTPEPFDVVAIKNAKGIINHAGVMINKREFIHWMKAGGVICSIHNRAWRPRIAGFYRYKND